MAFDGDAVREHAAQFLARAEAQGTTVPLLIAHRVMGISLVSTGDIANGRVHLDKVIALYDPAEHRSLTTRFSVDARVAALCFRSVALWFLGYPAAALADADHALGDAREIKHAITLMFALVQTSVTLVNCGNYAKANTLIDELTVLADEIGSLYWKAAGMSSRGALFALTGRAADAVQTISSGLNARQATGTTFVRPRVLSLLAKANAELGRFDDAWRCIHEAIAGMEATKETWHEVEIQRIAGEIALMGPEPDTAKAQGYFERALSVARAQQAKSWELRAAMSMARLWRDQGEPDEARDLLAPVYGWFTEGFDTLDLKEAKALLDELAS